MENREPEKSSEIKLLANALNGIGNSLWWLGFCLFWASWVHGCHLQWAARELRSIKVDALIMEKK